MNAEAALLLMEMYTDEWLDFQQTFADAVYEREGMGLFELHAAGYTDAVREALNGMDFFEWFAEFKTEARQPKRL